MNAIQARFGEKLREARSRRAITQETLADLSGLHRTYVSSVERGERNVSIQTIARFAEALGITMAELMPEPPPKSKRARKS